MAAREVPMHFDPTVEHPIDRIRPAFMRDVIGPLSHAAVNGTIDIRRDYFLTSLRGSGGRTFRSIAGSGRFGMLGGRHYYPDRDAAEALRILENSRAYPPLEHSTVYPVWDILTERQQRAARRFAVPATTPSPNEAFFLSSDTVAGTVNIIYQRHPELGLHDTTTMLDFLRDPMTPSLLRGFMPAGNRFMASLIGGQSHSEARPWAMDREKPLLVVTPGKPLRTTNELRKAAHDHRLANETMPTAELQKRVALISMKYSTGCPVRYLYFRTDNEELDAYGLNLSEDQVELLMSGRSPVVKQIEGDDNGYAIARDSVQEVVGLLADGLEIITPRRYKAKMLIQRIL